MKCQILALGKKQNKTIGLLQIFFVNLWSGEHNTSNNKFLILHHNTSSFIYLSHLSTVPTWRQSSISIIKEKVPFSYEPLQTSPSDRRARPFFSRRAPERSCPERPRSACCGWPLWTRASLSTRSGSALMCPSGRTRLVAGVWTLPQEEEVFTRRRGGPGRDQTRQRVK